MGDALAGRFMAVEAAAFTNSWQDAQHLEVIPAHHGGVTSPAVLLQAQRHAKQVEKATSRGPWEAPHPWGRAHCSPPGRRLELTAKGEGRHQRERSRSERRERWSRLEGQGEGQAGRGRWGEVSPEASDEAYAKALERWFASQPPTTPAPGAACAGGEEQGLRRLPPLSPDWGAEGQATGDARYFTAPSMDPTSAPVLPFFLAGAGDAKPSSLPPAAQLSWAKFETPAQLGWWLQAGVTLGSVPNGMTSLLNLVKHTASSDASLGRLGVFPLPVDFEFGGDAPHLAGATPEVQAWVNLGLPGIKPAVRLEKESADPAKGGSVPKDPQVFEG